MGDRAGAAKVARRMLARYRRLLGAVLAGVAVLLVVETLAPAAPRGRPVVVAAHDIDGGAVLSVSDVEVVEMPARLVPAGATGSRNGLIGRVAAGPLRAGEAITDVGLVEPALLARYPPGIVAAPVRIGDRAVVAMLGIGDRIDVYAARSDSSVADVVVSDVAVLAVPKVQADPQRGGLLVLAVTPSQAAALAEASATAPLSIALLR